MAFEESLGSITLQADASIGVFTGVSGLPGSSYAIQPPTGVSAVGSTTGGTIAAGTYYYVVTSTTALGETTASSEVTVTTTGTTSSVVVSWSPVTGATGYKVYRGTASGGELLLATVTGVNTVTATDTGGTTPSGALPTSNTSGMNSGYQFRFVKITGAVQAGLATAASNEQVVGVLQNKPQRIGDAATVALRGISFVQCGSGGLTAGNAVKVDANGQGIAASLPTDAALVVGIAVTTAGSGQLASVLLTTKA